MQNYKASIHSQKNSIVILYLYKVRNKNTYMYTYIINTEYFLLVNTIHAYIHKLGMIVSYFLVMVTRVHQIIDCPRLIINQVVIFPSNCKGRYFGTASQPLVTPKLVTPPFHYHPPLFTSFSFCHLSPGLNI